MTSSPNLPPSLFETTPWNPQPGSIWLTSTLCLRRNLSRFNFPAKLSDAEAQQAVVLLKKALKDAITGSHYFEDEKISSQDRQLLFEHFLLMQGMQHPPNGAGFVIDEESSLLATVNLSNHLELRILSPGGHFEQIWDKITQVEDQIGKALGFAFSPKFGYLTADPTECGTGLTVQAFLHVPALVHTQNIDGAIKNAEDPELDFFGLLGDLNNLIGDVLIIENRYTIGMSEETILHSVQGGVTKLQSAEKMMRDHLKKAPSAEVKDQISKAYGLLIHSHQLEIKEALDLLSLMKLGLSIGLITGVTDEKLNSLFFNCRKGHLGRRFPEITEPQEIEQRRADFLQKELEGISFQD